MGNDIDMNKPFIHLQTLQDVAISACLDGIAIKQMTRVHSLCDMFNHQPGLKNILTEVHKLLKRYVTVAVTTASVECSFSALKQIKNYLRNTITLERLNHCMLLYMHREKTDDLDLVENTNEYVSMRKNCLGNF